MKYDDILIPTDEIYLRIRDTKTEKERLEKVSGFVLEFCGRSIGIHRSISNWMWQATDMETGMMINPYNYVQRASLINFLLRNEEDYAKMFREVENLSGAEEIFREMRREIDGR